MVLSQLSLRDAFLALKADDLPTIEKPIGKLTALQSRPDPIAIVDGSLEVPLGAAELSLNTGSRLTITAINRKHTGDDDPEEDGEATAVIDYPRFPWSYREGSPEVALVYELNGAVRGRAGTSVPLTPTVDLAVGVEANTEMAVTYVRLHRPGDPFGPAVKEDIGRFRFGLDSDDVLALEPGREFVVTEFEAGIGFEARITWGKVFRGSPGLIRSFSRGAEALRIAAGADLGAWFGVAVNLRSRLQLIASRAESGSVHLEFRKADRRIRGASAGVAVAARIDQVAAVQEAVDDLLARLLEFDVEELAAIRARIAAFREDFGVAQLKDADLRAVARAVASKLGVDAPWLLRALEEGAWLEEAFGELAERTGLQAAVFDRLERALEVLHDRIDLSEEAESVRELAGRLLARIGLAPEDLALIGDLLRNPELREWIVSGVDGLSEAALQRLEETLREQLDRLPLEAIADEPARKLAALLEEEFSASLEDILQSFRMGRLLERMVGDRETVKQLRDGLHAAAAAVDLFGGDDDGLLGTVDKLIAFFGNEVSPFAIDVELEKLAQALKNAVEAQVAFSAKLEFSKITTREALLAFGLDGATSGDPVFKDLYSGLLRGDWQRALALREAYPKRFRQFRFLLGDTIERQRSGEVNFLSLMIQGGRYTTRRSQMRNLEGDGTRLVFSERMRLYGGGRAKGRRWWSSYDLTAAMDRFSDSPRTNQCTLTLELSLSWEALVVGPRTRHRNNRRAMEYMARILGDSGKSDAPPEHFVGLVRKAFSRDHRPGFQLDLDVEHGVLMDLIDRDLKARMLSNLSWCWERARSEYGLFPNFVGGMDQLPQESVDAVDALFEILLLIREDRPTDELRPVLRQWKRAYHAAVRDLHGRDFLFKFCLLHAWAITLPADEPGWSLTGRLRLGDDSAAEEVMLA